MFKFLYDLVVASVVLGITTISYFWVWTKEARLNSFIRYGNLGLIGLELTNVTIAGIIGTYRIL